MEPAKIDWETIHSVFVKDDLFEHFNAPQWVDFSAPEQESIDDDDDAWFCTPDCNHPKTIEDFLQRSTSPSKILQRSPNLSQILPLGDRNKRDANLKRRGLAQPLFSSPKYDRFVENGENQNPNFPTTPSHQQTSMKAAIKSSTKKKKHTDSFSQKEDRLPHLKSTLSARNLFGGRNILSQITEFCNDLKKLATRAKESENVEKSLVVVKKSKENECTGESMGELDDVREKERKPLLEVNKERCEMEKSNVKEKLRRKKRADEAENIPISLDVKNVKHKEGDVLSQIRTCPPSPQCFSAGRGPSKATPLKSNRSRPPERGILQELDRCCNTELPKEEAAYKNNRGRTPSIVAEREEPRTLDVFWFLKPCTLSS